MLVLKGIDYTNGNMLAAFFFRGLKQMEDGDRWDGNAG